jgi:cysteinyl-tRNA synthetase
MEKSRTTTYYAGLLHGGDGFPGWHLECTAMSTKYLGIILIFTAVEWI